MNVYNENDLCLLCSFIYFHFMCISVLPYMYVCVRVSDPLELELKTAVIGQMVVGS